jgi:hypothetical protein
LTRSNMTVPHSPCISLFYQLKIKLKGRHFDTVEVIEADSQAMMNTLTEHDFQDALKKKRQALETVHNRGRGPLRGQRWPAGSKLVFDKMAAQVPEIMDETL